MSCFIRIHRSYLIAVSKIDYLEGNQVFIKSQILPVGRQYKEELQNRLSIAS